MKALSYVVITDERDYENTKTYVAEFIPANPNSNGFMHNVDHYRIRAEADSLAAVMIAKVLRGEK